MNEQTVADIDLKLFVNVHNEAVNIAKSAAQTELNKMGGDRGACGFAWVNIWNVRKNSKLGKVLETLGYSKNYEGAMNLWNPSGLGCQNIDAKESGANAYVHHMKKTFPQLTIYSGSRLD